MLLLLVAVTSAAALPGLRDEYANCTPGDFSCAQSDFGHETVLWTCNSQRQLVVSAVCGTTCCREDRERHTAYCVC
ncbi:hypothetical protein A9K55_007036 [Cordyceps militaris]|uniref:Uncharacterized protein n=1 Tax=Cordyceps militaris TaxID=73501 RepID=A0A2H4SF43_CORMI|nr:hypothetical protein A9K55_007036 [Cordyceps militaris]